MSPQTFREEYLVEVRPGRGQPLKLLALTGRPGVGKYACAQVLQQRGYSTIAFADALRKEVAAAWLVDERMLTHRQTKEWPILAMAPGMCGEPEFLAWCGRVHGGLQDPRSPRWALQNWATWRRESDPDYFVKIVARWINRQAGIGFNKIAITDLRFANEEAMLRNLGGQVIRVHRPDATQLNDDTAGHESEQQHQAIQADADITNDGSLEALAEAVMSCPLVMDLADWAREYSIRCETYDREVCTGPIGQDGAILPNGPREMALITRHAQTLRLELQRQARCSEREFRDALLRYELSSQSRIDLQAIALPLGVHDYGRHGDAA